MAQVGFSSLRYEGNTCNMHLNDLAAKVKESVVVSGAANVIAIAAESSDA